MLTTPMFPLTYRANVVFKIASDEARRDGVPAIRPQHILRGLACEGEGPAAIALELYGLNADIRAECASYPNHSDLKPSERAEWSVQGRRASKDLNGRAKTIFDRAVVEAERLSQIMLPV